MAFTPKQIVPGAQIANSVTTYYTATNVRTRIDACSLTNTTAAAVNVTLHIVPSGGTADDTNTILDTRPVGAGETFVPVGIIGHWMKAGDTLQAVASAATSVTIFASGIEYT